MQQLNTYIYKCNNDTTWTHINTVLLLFTVKEKNSFSSFQFYCVTMKINFDDS